MKIVGCDSQERNEVARSFGDYDIYDTAEYHRIASRGQNYQPHLFFFEQAEYRMALPLVLRSIDARLCDDRGWADAPT